MGQSITVTEATFETEVLVRSVEEVVLVDFLPPGVAPAKF